MKPILYNNNETAFDTNGIGILGDAVSCIVTEERNGVYQLEMEYPITGIHYADLQMRNIIMAKPNPTSDPQPFRIYDASRPMAGIITVYAQHISYDMAGIVVSPYAASDAQGALLAIPQYAATACPFSFQTDKSTTGKMTVAVPTAAWNVLGGQEGSILDVYGGEYEFDRWTVKLHAQRGYDRGVTIRYGKNLTDIRQEESCAAVYTGIYPYWVGMEGELVTLPEKIVNASGSFNFTRISPLDLSEEWEEAPTEEQIRARAQSYIRDNNIGVPEVNLTVEFVQLEQTEEYKGMALLERVSLCDTVRVEFPAMGVSATAKCIKTVYNVLLDRYDSVEIGDARTSLADIIVGQEKEIQKKPEISDMRAAILSLTATILGASGGAVRLLDTNGDKMPDTLYIADDPDPEKAVKVWRFNYEGWGASENGYNGPFTMGATLDNGMLANFITAGVLDANLIKAGIISDKAGLNFWNMLTGEFSLSSSAKIGDSTISDVVTDVAEAAAGSAASTAVTNYDNALKQAAILNKLTNNGQAVGIYLQDGQLYINASYVKSGAISADLIDVAELLSKTINVNQINIVTEDGAVALSMKYGVTETFSGRGIEIKSSGSSMTGYLSTIKAVGNDLTIRSDYGIALMPGGLHGAGEKIWLGGDTHVAGDLSVSGALSIGSLTLSEAPDVTANETYSAGSSTLDLSEKWNNYEESLYLNPGTYIVFGSVSVSNQGYGYTSRILVGSNESAGSRSSVFCGTSHVYSTQSAAIIRLTSKAYVYLSVWAGAAVSMSDGYGGGTWLRAVRIFS